MVTHASVGGYSKTEATLTEPWLDTLSGSTMVGKQREEILSRRLQTYSETNKSLPPHLHPNAIHQGELRRLADMKADGLLSDNEFHAAKAKLLAS